MSRAGGLVLRHEQRACTGAASVQKAAEIIERVQQWEHGRRTPGEVALRPMPATGYLCRLARLSSLKRVLSCCQP